MNKAESKITKTLFIFLILLSNSFNVSAQNEINYVPLTEIGQKEIEPDAFKAIESYFDDVIVAGLGESTHGTSEFHTLRAQLFKYLVKNKGFNTFFLEADYADCIPISEYVAGKDIDVRKAMDGLYWPWQAEELLSLIEWMRAYNDQQGSDNKLRFIGIDGQWNDAGTEQLNKLLISYELQPLDSEQFPLLANNEYLDLKKRHTKSMLEYIRTYKKKDVSSFAEGDQVKYHLLIKNLEQSLEGQLSKCAAFRDTKMGQNILENLKNKPETKAIFWAHNFHIYNVLGHYDKKSNEQHGMAGGILKQALKDQYVSIMQDFDSGSFIAYHKINDSKKEKIENYTLGKVRVEKSIPGSYGEKLRGIQEEIIFIDLDENGTEVGEYKNHSIGAVFRPEKNNKNQTTQFNYCPRGDCFDAVLFTKKSTPINQIPN